MVLEAAGGLFADLGCFIELSAEEVSVFVNTTGLDFTGGAITIGAGSYTFGDIGAGDLRGANITGGLLAVSDFVSITGDLSVRDFSRSFTLADASSVDADVITVGGNDLTAFAGYGAVTADRPGTARLRSRAHRCERRRRAQLVALRGTADDVGIEGARRHPHGVRLLLEINRGSEGAGVIDFSADPLAIVVGATT